MEHLERISNCGAETSDTDFVLLIHPHLVIEELRKRGKVSDAWYLAYNKRFVEVGARKPAAPGAGRLPLPRITA
jgi:hypothetical protein